MALAQSRQNMTDHPKLLLREESDRHTASVWVLIKLNQTHLASLLAVLVELSFVQIKSWCRRSVSTAQPLPSHPSAVQHQDPEGHTQQDRETVQGYLSNVPSLTVSPVTDNCVLTQLEFLHSLHKRGLWTAQTLCQPLRGPVWRRALSLTQGVHSLSIPTSKAGITTLPLFTDVQLELWHLH